MTRQMDTSWASIWPPLLLGQLCLVQGQCEPATSFLEEAIGLAEHNGALQALRWAQGALAERDLLEHRPQVAYARLQPLLDRSGQEESDATKLLPLLAWAHLELGEERQAGAVLGQCITRATAQNMRLVLADALRIEALLATRQAHWDVAECTIAEALALSRAMPSPYAEAKVYYVYGHMLAWKGELELARERLRTALAILSRLGERLYAERVEQGLAQLS